MKQKLLQSMKKACRATNGFSLVEIVLAGALFTVLVTTMAGALIYSKDTTASTGDNSRAVLLAEEAVEALKNIKDADFAQLTDGTHGLQLTNEWNLTGSSDITDNFFTRSIEIASVDTDRKIATTTIVWNPREGVTSTYELGVRLTNWRAQNTSTTSTPDNEATYLDVNTSTSYLSNNDTRIYGTTVQNTSSTGNITIASMIISWTGGVPGTLLDRIRIDGNSVWTNDIVSGATADISDYTLTAGSIAEELRLYFTDDMAGTVVTIQFTMLDGSTREDVIYFSIPPSQYEATYLAVNTSTSYLDTNNNNEIIYGTTVQNTHTTVDITIASMIISWTGGVPGTLLDRIRIDGNSVWTNDIVSGATADISDYTLTAGSIAEELRLYFTDDMAGTVVTIQFTMLDGSTREDVIILNAPLNESDYLNIDGSGAYLYNSNKRISGVDLTNIAPFGNITITSMRVSWTGGSGPNQLDSIKIGGSTVWSPNVNSGTLVNITDTSITSGDTAQTLRIYFTQSMVGTTVTVEFTMADASIYTATPMSF